MADDGEDILRKVDAILGRRSGFAGGRTDGEGEFPVLTEVIGAPIDPLKRAATADAMAAPAPTEARPDAPRHAPPAPAPLGELEIDRLAAALEARLSELFLRQQMRTEALIRRIVREEIERRDGDGN